MKATREISNMLSDTGAAAANFGGGLEGAGVEDVAGGGLPGAYVRFKVAFEWAVALVLLVVSAPLVGLLAALVKLTSPGPAFYRQTRVGLNGRHYSIYKLRTMRHNCEAQSGPVWAAKNDSRITPIGKILRETHLDELPQLINVLAGHMSLIGPRPERPEFVARLERTIPGYRGRHSVRPGVTGLAQMRLPADSDLEGVRLKLAHDLYYVRRLSLAMDLRIAVSTVFYFIGAAADGFSKIAVSGHGDAALRAWTDEATPAREQRDQRDPRADFDRRDSQATPAALLAEARVAVAGAA
jgi:lipopolysaccharide/colanic/teichoic acid biosynthesis glycosyltransferase